MYQIASNNLTAGVSAETIAAGMQQIMLNGVINNSSGNANYSANLQDLYWQSIGYVPPVSMIDERQLGGMTAGAGCWKFCKIDTCQGGVSMVGAGGVMVVFSV